MVVGTQEHSRSTAQRSCKKRCTYTYDVPVKHSLPQGHAARRAGAARDSLPRPRHAEALATKLQHELAAQPCLHTTLHFLSSADDHATSTPGSASQRGISARGRAAASDFWLRAYGRTQRTTRRYGARWARSFNLSRGEVRCGPAYHCCTTCYADKSACPDFHSSAPR